MSGKSIFGNDYKGRKSIPLLSFFVRYFPKALIEVTKVCVAGNVQHNPELKPTDINWSREKSTDHLNTAMRHIFDHMLCESVFDDEPPEVQALIGQEGTYHLAKAAWRILAELQLVVERQEAKKMPKPLTFLEPGLSAHRCNAADDLSLISDHDLVLRRDAISDGLGI